MLSLKKLAKPTGPMDPKELKLLEQWLDEDWESHDQDPEVIRLIRRLLLTLKPKGDTEGLWEDLYGLAFGYGQYRLSYLKLFNAEHANWNTWEEDLLKLSDATDKAKLLLLNKAIIVAKIWNEKTKLEVKAQKEKK